MGQRRDQIGQCPRERGHAQTVCLDHVPGREGEAVLGDPGMHPPAGARDMKRVIDRPAPQAGSRGVADRAVAARGERSGVGPHPGLRGHAGTPQHGTHHDLPAPVADQAALPVVGDAGTAGLAAREAPRLQQGLRRFAGVAEERGYREQDGAHGGSLGEGSLPVDPPTRHLWTTHPQTPRHAPDTPRPDTPRPAAPRRRRTPPAARTPPATARARRRASDSGPGSVGSARADFGPESTDFDVETGPNCRGGGGRGWGGERVIGVSG